MRRGKIRQSGFTIIEILTVICIIALFAVLILVGLRVIRERSKDVKQISDIRGIDRCLQVYAGENGEKYPVSNGDGSVESLGDKTPTGLLIKDCLGTMPTDSSGNKYKYFARVDQSGLEKPFTVYTDSGAKQISNQPGNKIIDSATGQELTLKNSKIGPIFHSGIFPVEISKRDTFGRATQLKITAPSVYSIESEQLWYRARIKKNGTNIWAETAFQAGNEIEIDTTLDEAIYWVKVDVKDIFGNKHESELFSFNTFMVDLVKPTLVNNENLVKKIPCGDYHLCLNWTDRFIDDSGVKFYQVQYKKFDEDVWKNKNSYGTIADITVIVGQYESRVFAFDEYGNKSEALKADNISVTGDEGKMDVLPPGFLTPGNFSVVRNGSDFMATCIDAIDNVGIVKYQIKLSEADNPEMILIDQDSDVRSVKFSNFKLNTRYSAKCDAVDAAGNVGSGSQIYKKTGW